MIALLAKNPEGYDMTREILSRKKDDEVNKIVEDNNKSQKEESSSSDDEIDINDVFSDN